MEFNKNKIDVDTQKQKEIVLDYLRKHNLVSYKDNVICAPKAFVVNAVIRWALAQKQMTNLQQGKLQKMVAQYLAGVVELTWDNGKIQSVEVINDK